MGEQFLESKTLNHKFNSRVGCRLRLHFSRQSMFGFRFLLMSSIYVRSEHLGT